VTSATRPSLLRPSTGDASHRVTFVELFFDLVFVFAVTQLSHLLVHEQDALALVHTAVLTMVVWMAWVSTTWALSWLNPERGPVSGLLFVLMGLGMLLAATIPQAFTTQSLAFALALFAFNVGHSAFTMIAFARHRPEHAGNFARITSWHVVAGAVWIVGALLPANVRLWVWLAALALNWIAPRVFFWVPMFGRSHVETWDVSGEHMSERVSLFFIIALGESIVVTGTAFAGSDFAWPSLAAFLAAFVGTVLMFLLYFRHNARGGSDYISHAGQRGMIAQTTYTYIPILLVFGIVGSAVADGLVLRDPAGGDHPWVAGLLCGSAALYVLGNALFTRSTGGPWLWTHLAGAVVLTAMIALFPIVDPLPLSWIVNLVLAGIVLREVIALRPARSTAE
jgi:low temperature requirement protein LtrA